MADLLSLSARYVDEGVYDGPASVNRVTCELSEVGDGVAVVESFSHVVALRSHEGLALFDASLEALAPAVLRSLRGWSDAPLHTLTYTHGHIDHVGGGSVFCDEARERGHPGPRVVAHENVPARFDRYRLTEGYNFRINARQFGRGGRGRGGMESMGGDPKAVAGGSPGRFGPERWERPGVTFRDRLQLQVGDLELQLRHERGETDDHLWAWVPRHRAICAGDFVLWVFPNAGNPQKVQRYPLEWARALRAMQALEPELLLPAHGLPVAGAARIHTLLGDTALALEALVEQTLRMMNEGLRLDEILHAVRVPAELMERPYLRPVYDEPEFVIHNVWRLYGGWYDGNPAHLKPAPDAALAAEVSALAGGAGALVARARALAEAGELRLACHLVEMAVQASPEDRQAHAARAEVYEQRRKAELSLMARGIYGDAARRSARLAGIDL